jgi:hypothetical protein
MPIPRPDTWLSMGLVTVRLPCQAPTKSSSGDSSPVFNVWDMPREDYLVWLEDNYDEFLTKLPPLTDTGLPRMFHLHYSLDNIHYSGRV